MVKRGCRVALGLDGSTLDEDDDALREMRLAHLLHRGTGVHVPMSTARRCCEWRSSNGRLSVTNKDDGGALAPGEPADILVLDWDAVDDERLRGGSRSAAISCSRAPPCATSTS